MKAGNSIKLKKEQIEINIVEMFKYVCVRCINIFVVSVILAILLPCAKYVIDKDNINKEQLEEVEVPIDSKMLKAYTNSYDAYVKALEEEKSYQENSILFQLDYRNISTATIQLYVDADEENLMDALTAYANYNNDGGLVADIYKIDNSVEERFLKEIIRVTCSTYGNYDISSVIGVKIYGRDMDECKKYVEYVTNVFNTYCKILNESGVDNSILKIYENYYYSSDSSIWTSKQTVSNTISNIDTNIKVIQTQIEELKNKGVILPEEIIGGAKKAAFSIKFAVVGFALGLIFAILYYVIKYILGNKFKYENELSEMAPFRCIGTLSSEHYGCLEKIIRKIIFRDKYSTAKEEYTLYNMKMLAKNSGDEKIQIIGDSFSCEQKKLTEIQNHLKEENVSAYMVGDIVKDIDKLKDLEERGKAILAISYNKTSYAYVEEMIKLCEVKETEILGYIYIG